MVASLLHPPSASSIECHHSLNHPIHSGAYYKHSVFRTNLEKFRVNFLISTDIIANNINLLSIDKVEKILTKRKPRNRC